MAHGVQVTFDCADPDRLARFWASALGYVLQPPPDGYGSWEAWLAGHGVPEEERNRASAIVDPDGRGPRIYFQRVPEPKVTKNRVHLDLNVAERGTPPDERRRRVRAEADRLVAEGATEVETFDREGEHWIVMRDPEENEFCLQ